LNQEPGRAFSPGVAARILTLFSSEVKHPNREYLNHSCFSF
jgi:hypothetical protein